MQYKTKILESYYPAGLEKKIEEYLNRHKYDDFEIHYSNSQGLIAHTYTALIILK
jgi:hypothetical protein